MPRAFSQKAHSYSTVYVHMPDINFKIISKVSFLDKVDRTLTYGFHFSNLQFSLFVYFLTDIGMYASTIANRIQSVVITGYAFVFPTSSRCVRGS